MSAARLSPPPFSPSALVLNDHPMMLALTKRSLQDHSCQVVAASDGVEALVAAVSRRFDLVLSDIPMPRMDGIARFKRLRNVHMSPRVVLMSADPFADPIIPGVDFVVKSIHAEDPRDLIDQVSLDRMMSISGALRATAAAT